MGEKTKRLEVLERSLAKKKALFDEKLNNHISTVKQANGQPLNDKRNGQATLNKWDRQNESLKTLQDSIGKTERAIERETGKILDVESAKETLPCEILELIEAGELIQWRKHPNTFFVKGVDKARIVWDSKKKIVAHRYSKTITDAGQWKIFARTFNELIKKIAA
jgi:hypothetical protein